MASLLLQLERIWDPSSSVPTEGSAEERLLARGSARVLIAEDNAINQEVAIELLRSVGLEVDTANDGLEAVRRCEAQRYDLVLMDLQMPHMDGLAATRLIRALPGHQDLPIIALTADAFEDDRRSCLEAGMNDHSCLEAGMNDHIGKPVDPSVRFEKLARWLPPRAKGAESTTEEVTAHVQTRDGERLRDLSLVEGLDVEAGLASVRGSVRVYLDLLRRFAEGHHGDITELRRCWAERDRESAQRIVHTLKGLTATLGMPSLTTRAARLEKGLAARAITEPIDPVIDAFEVGLAGLTSRIRAVLDDPSRPLPPPPSRSRGSLRSSPEVQELLALLSEDDLRSTAAFWQVRDLLGSRMGGRPSVGCSPRSMPSTSPPRRRR